ncbi:hypothetical protein [Streptomyces sp. NBC_00286]|uniref:hypothetical protein n=1 Tax=Streptomyces sp. NBC_00286 TaxID=2975701 RepID=UPI002E2B5262|nr:hypothetical protein [Streptomyces sp. NBC_00286]
MAQRQWRPGERVSSDDGAPRPPLPDLPCLPAMRGYGRLREGLDALGFLHVADVLRPPTAARHASFGSLPQAETDRGFRVLDGLWFTGRGNLWQRVDLDYVQKVRTDWLASGDTRAAGAAGIVDTLVAYVRHEPMGLRRLLLWQLGCLLRDGADGPTEEAAVALGVHRDEARPLASAVAAAFPAAGTARAAAERLGDIWPGGRLRETERLVTQVHDTGRDPALTQLLQSLHARATEVAHLTAEATRLSATGSARAAAPAWLRAARRAADDPAIEAELLSAAAAAGPTATSAHLEVTLDARTVTLTWPAARSRAGGVTYRVLRFPDGAPGDATELSANGSTGSGQAGGATASADAARPGGAGPEDAVGAPGGERAAVAVDAAVPAGALNAPGSSDAPGVAPGTAGAAHPGGAEPEDAAGPTGGERAAVAVDAAVPAGALNAPGSSDAPGVAPGTAGAAHPGGAEPEDAAGPTGGERAAVAVDAAVPAGALNAPGSSDAPGVAPGTAGAAHPGGAEPEDAAGPTGGERAAAAADATGTAGAVTPERVDGHVGAGAAHPGGVEPEDAAGPTGGECTAVVMDAAGTAGALNAAGGSDGMDAAGTEGGAGPEDAAGPTGGVRAAVVMDAAGTAGAVTPERADGLVGTDTDSAGGVGAEGRVLSRTDVDAPVGRPLRYAVVPVRRGVIAGVPLVGAPIVIAPDVGGVAVTLVPEGVRLRWGRPDASCSELSVQRRAVGGPAVSVACGRDGVLDVPLDPGEYTYEVRCGYPGPGGQTVWSPGVRVGARAEEWPGQVEDLAARFVGDGGRVALTWRPPERGLSTVLPWRSVPVGPGTDVSARAGLTVPEAPAGAEPSVEVAVPERARLRMTSVSMLGERKVTGPDVVVEHPGQVRDLTVHRVTPDRATVRFEWPEPAVLVVVTWEGGGRREERRVARSRYLADQQVSFGVTRDAYRVTVAALPRPDALAVPADAAVVDLPEVPAPPRLFLPAWPARSPSPHGWRTRWRRWWPLRR